MTVFNEGVFREEFLNDPTLGVGVINYDGNWELRGVESKVKLPV
jgi:hypothetical protein